MTLLALLIGCRANCLGQVHDLRHSCATFLVAQKEHPNVISAILGHAQISTTMDIYGHVLGDTLRAATDKIEDLFRKRE